MLLMNAFLLQQVEFGVNAISLKKAIRRFEQRYRAPGDTHKTLTLSPLGSAMHLLCEVLMIKFTRHGDDDLRTPNTKR